MRTVHEHDGAKVIQLRDEPATHLIGDHISISIYEYMTPGEWNLNCAAARIEDQAFKAKPHDVDDALRVAINLVSDRMSWLMKQWRREIVVMQKAIGVEQTDEQATRPSTDS